MSQLSLRSTEGRSQHILVFVVFSALCVATLYGCSPHVEPQTPQASSPAEQSPPQAADHAARPLPALTAQEQALEQELRTELDALLALGSRGSDSWSLADATDHLVSQLTGYGYEVNRRGFTWKESVAQNLEVEAPGLRRGDEVIVIAARMDSNPESPGADDNASGMAALMSLARHFQGQRRLRTLRFVWFSSAGPRAETEAQGAFGYLKNLKDSGTKVVAAIELHGLGRYSQEKGSQRFPDGVVGDGGSSGDFVALVSHPGDEAVAERTGTVLREASSLPVKQWVLSRSDDLVQGSGHAMFSEAGYPSLLLTDTQKLRQGPGEFGTQKDTAAGLDYARMARLTNGMIAALEALAGPRGEVPTEMPQSDEQAKDLKKEPSPGAAPSTGATSTSTEQR